MFMSISSMRMDEYRSSIFTSMRSGTLRLTGGQKTFRSEAIRVSFARGTPKKAYTGFYYPVGCTPRALRNCCWFQGRSCSGFALLHGCRCGLDADELRRRGVLQRARGFGVRVFFPFVFLNWLRCIGDYSIMSMRRHDALEKAGMRKWHAICLLLQRSVTKLMPWPFDYQTLKPS